MEEKQLPPTKKKLQDARKKGDVAYSADFSYALVLIGAALVFFLGIPRLYRAWTAFFKFEGNLQETLRAVILYTGGMLVCLFLLTIGASLLQTGWVWSRKGGRQGKRRVLFPITFLSCLAYFLISSKRPQSIVLTSPVEQMKWMGKHLLFFAATLMAALLIWGVIDLIYQKFVFLKKMRMTKQELKEELKEEESCAETKRRLRKR